MTFPTISKCILTHREVCKQRALVPGSPPFLHSGRRLWKVMAPLSYPPMPPIYWMSIVFLLTMCSKPALCCDMVICYDRYIDAKAAVTYGRINKTSGEDPECIPLRTQLECIISLDVKCKRNIQYEGIKQGIKINMNKTGCHVNGVTLRPDDSRVLDPRDKPYQDLLMCSLKGKRSERQYKHCSLFGDPHLRTFDNEFQTCKVEGTWTLIYNRNLSVQVTNDPVVSDGSATATSKLTVMIKKNVDCAASEFKTYMAQTDYLPATFSDGMTHYGPERSVYLRVLEPGKNIEIYLRYIDTTIRVRQIGRYFTFAIKMPESIVDESRKLDEEQLCIQGCPKRERIDYQRYLAEKREVALQKHGSIKMTREEASKLCRKEKVVDFYFDSCVFDLMTTGDTNFTMAAYQAWQDLIILSPEFVPRHQNRTDFKKYDDEIHSGSRRTTQSEYFWIIVLSVLICVYFRHTDS